MSLSGRDDDAAPPRPTRGLVWRGLLAGALITLCTAGAVSASVLLFLDDVVPRTPGLRIPGLDRTDAGKAQTLMILGSDRRHGDAGDEPPRSDTIIVVRLDPDAEVTTMTSIPRDLLVDVPGVGSDVKINAAYEHGGPQGALRAVKRLLSVGGREFKINHVITVDFSGFRRAIDEVGCVYADIDREYFNDQGGPGGYAVIDIDPGYQKLCGEDALAYVRYRHRDNDLVRAARQQEFLRQARTQDGVEALMGRDLGNLRRVARMFGRYFDSDSGLRDRRELFRFAKTVMFTAGKPVRQVRFRAVQAPADPNSLVASREMLRDTVSELMRGRAAPRATPSAPRARRSPGRPRLGLEPARVEGESQAILGARRIDFPLFFPTLRTDKARYAQPEPRTYRIDDTAGNAHDAYRLVLAAGYVGEYYGVQGTTWRDPPILEDPDQTIVRDGRTLFVFRDGGRVRLVAWRTRKAVYWVSNTLTRSLSSAQMLGIAASLKRLGG